MWQIHYLLTIIQSLQICIPWDSNISIKIHKYILKALVFIMSIVTVAYLMIEILEIIFIGLPFAFLLFSAQKE